MKIDSLSSGRSGATRKSGRSGSAASGSAFARSLASEPAQNAAPMAGPTSIGRIDSILALQEVPDPSARRKRAVRRGEELLDELDRIRLGLLTGQISRDDLERLALSLEQRVEPIEDEGLAEALAEIELRVAVELAKLQA